MYNSISIKGAKKKPKQPRKPVIAKDSAASMSFFKGDYGTSEGEIYGLVDGGKSIFLEGTPLLDDDGNPNFEGVTWEERKGTLDQEYMKGFPDVSNEVGIGVELKGGTPWVRSITNTQLSALRLRFKWDRLAKTNPDNGDVTGYRIDYAIDLRTDGGAYQEVLSTKIEDKTSAGYERTHRIDLPKSKTGWSVRVRRITPNADSEYISDKMYIDALAEVIDVKLAYPLTAGIGLQYNAELFNGVAKVEFLKRGRILKVPTNYNAETRQYTGIWDGTFKEAYSNNPAWVYYDLLTNKRYGLGNRLDVSMIDKWGIYNLARYCDEMVSDGQGGLEPRFTCNVYLQKQATAYEVLQHIAGIFSALSYWNGEKIFLDADIPRDPVFTFTNANVVGGNFSYSGTRDRDRHNIIKVAWGNPANGFKTEYEYVRDEKSIAMNGIKPLDLAAFGCTSQSQAQRLGLRALKTEQLETQQVTFSTGLAAINCKIGDVIAISDASLAGKSNGGLISNVAGNVITIDRDAVINIGDTLTVNTAKGLSERRNVTAVNGRQITVAAAFDGAEREHVWSVESSDLKMQLFRVISVTENDDATYSVLGIQHEPQKFNAIDFGTDVKPTSISIVDDIAITPPESVVIKSRHRVEQGQTVATLIIEWPQVKEAVAYEVEWRKDDGSWIRVPRTGTNSVEIDGVYAGQYLARVRSVGAFDSVSNPTTSLLTEVKGKVGKPPKLANLTATGTLFGMELNWSFAKGSGDAAYTEIQVASAPDTNVALLGQYSYPTNNAKLNGLQSGLVQYYRGRIVDKLGFKGDWSNWIKGEVLNDSSQVLDLIAGDIEQSHLNQALGQKIDKIDVINQDLSQEVINRQNAINQVSQDIADVSTAVSDETQARIEAISQLDEGVSQEITQLKDADTAVNGRVDTLVSKTDANTAAIQFEATARTDGDSALGSRIDTVAAKSDGNTAAISSEAKTRADEDSALSSRIDTVSSKTDDNAASITNVSNTLTNELGSQAEQINIIKADYSPRYADKTRYADKSRSAQWTYWKTVARDNYATNERITVLQSDVADSKAEITQSLNTLAKKDEALASSIDAIAVKTGSNTAAIQSESVARTDADSALSTRIDTVVATAGDNTAAIQAEQKARADAYSALSQRVDTVQSSTATAQETADQAKTAANNAATAAGNKGEVIYQSQTPAASKRLSQNLWIDTTGGKNTPKRWDGASWVAVTDKAALDAQNAANEAQSTADEAMGKANTATSNIATIKTELTATTSKTNATANQVTTIQTTVNGHTSSIQTQQTSIDGLSAQSVLTLDVNGYVAGHGTYNDGKKGTFAVRADEFWIGGTDGTRQKGFVYYTSPQTINGVTVPKGLYLDNATIANGTLDIAKINKATITSLSAISANIGHFKSAETGARLEIKDSLLEVYDGNNKLRVRLGIW